MTETLTPKLLVLGGGPGGYVGAIRAGQLGLDTVLVEGDRLGGTYLIRGCIPSKAMIHAASSFHDLALHAEEDRAGGKAGGFCCQAPPRPRLTGLNPPGLEGSK